MDRFQLDILPLVKQKQIDKNVGPIKQKDAQI